jgi:hypothetical protein
MGGPSAKLTIVRDLFVRMGVADLIVVDGDPLKDIAVLQDISRI